jgi:hypothetical protein
MQFQLPQQSKVDKFIAKTKFSAFGNVPHKIKQEFTDKIQKITWRYKLAESTINISPTEQVEEIQIFEIQLKEKDIPKKVLSVIDKTIPYPILYVFIYEKSTAYGITLKEDAKQRYYFSDWNENLHFDFSGTNLEQVYQKIIRTFVEKEHKTDTDFQTLISKDIQKETLTREISALENKIKNERQFKKQVELHKELQTKKKQLETL